MALLIIIYFAFISLGLPDGLLGSSWTVMHLDLNSSISNAGIFSMAVSALTITSSLFCGKLTAKFGTGKLCTFSVLLTALGLFGISTATSFPIMMIYSIPLGLGAGAVDSSLNNFVALHYKARHMNWLHTSWGIGATAGPIIMSVFLVKQNGWRLGYLTFALVQFSLVILLFSTLKIWKNENNENEGETKETKSLSLKTLIAIPGVKASLLVFFCYCSMENIVGLWGSSYLVFTKAIPAQKAAQWVGYYYLGITLGRLLMGFLSFHFDDDKRIIFGNVFIFIGITLLFFQKNSIFQMIGFIIIGFGFAPIFPAMIHSNPTKFSKETSAGIIGLQMAFAYLGITLMPPLFGYVAKALSFKILPYAVLLFTLIQILSIKILINKTKS